MINLGPKDTLNECRNMIIKTMNMFIFNKYSFFFYESIGSRSSFRCQSATRKIFSCVFTIMTYQDNSLFGITSAGLDYNHKDNCSQHRILFK